MESSAGRQDDLPIALAISGASGAPYGIRLLETLLRLGREVHLTISPSAVRVIEEETGRQVDLEKFDPAQLLGESFRETERLTYYFYKDYSAGIASGSFRSAGMAITPCSMSTLNALASGITTNLIQRAGDVCLKERRKLILTPRETPLNLISLENMARLTRAGAVILPAMPGFYHRPESIDDLVDFVVARILDQLGVEHDLGKRWGAAINS